jgi:hypothetical protein
MSPAGFESIIPASERLQTRALESAATGMGLAFQIIIVNSNSLAQINFPESL